MRVKTAAAGSLESSDVLVTISPVQINRGACPEERSENTLTIESPVMRQFGARIRAVSEEVIAASGIEGAMVRVQDRGALECTLRARLETALERAAAE